MNIPMKSLQINDNIPFRVNGSGFEKKETYFLPAPRASSVTIEKQRQSIHESGWLRWVVDSLPDGVAILNEQRQIIFANEAFGSGLSILQNEADSCEGQRPGETLNCIHAFSMPGGCGTALFCTVCGAGQAMQQALQNKSDVRECRISRENQGAAEALDLRVSTTPFTYDGELYILFLVHDISNERRRESLERIFFHDIANTAQIIYGVSELMQMRTHSTTPDPELESLLTKMAARLLDEIDAQKTLLEAEEGRLEVSLEPLLCRDVLHAQIEAYQPQAEAQGVQLMADTIPDAGMVLSDGRLLGRVLGNLIKNALEACPVEETVKVGFRDAGERVAFWVHTPVHMPPKVQLQIFQRSFSTKGAGRGLGTYSIKLLSERYLQGEVTFRSTPEAGTEFVVTLPKAQI